MSHVFITGSVDGLGLLAAKQLVAAGHTVTLHGRSEARLQDGLGALGAPAGGVHGDLSSIAGTRALAEQAIAAGPFDAVIHNAGVYSLPDRSPTEDGLPTTFQVNVLAPYLLTALLPAPARLVYLSSGLHRSAGPDLADLDWTSRPWNGMQAYCDSKFFDAALALAVARRWPEVRSNAVDPGWVPTKMGGSGAPDDLDLGADTQAWLAAGDDPAAELSGRYLHHREVQDPHASAVDPAVQDKLLAACERLTGVALPEA